MFQINALGAKKLLIFIQMHCFHNHWHNKSPATGMVKKISHSFGKKSPNQQLVKAQTAEPTPRRPYPINPWGGPRISTLCKFPGTAASSGTSLRTELFCCKILILILFPVFGQQLLSAPGVHGAVQQGVG